LIFLLSILAFNFAGNSLPAEDGVKVQKVKDGVQTGTISGKVFNPDMKPCPEAGVEVKLDKKNKIAGQSDGKGMYLLSGVPAGSGYSVSAKKDNLSVTVKSVNVAPGKNTTIDLILAKKK